MKLKRIYVLNEEGGGDGGGGASDGGGSAGSTSGSDIAGFVSPMLMGASKFKNKKDKKDNNPKVRLLTFLNNRNWKPTAVLKEYYDNDLVRGFDAKLTSIEDKAKRDRNSEAFALEDLNGNIIKVYVDRTQSRDFQAEISSMIEDEYGNKNDIAEILYTLKDKYTIYDIVWPKEAIPKDEEEEVEGEDVEGVDDVSEDDLGDDLEPSDEGDVDLNDLDGTEEEAGNLLAQFIELMKKDLEVKEAEAKSKQAEYEAKIAEKAEGMALKSAEKTEQILDMEEFERREKEAEEEEKINKRLLKYRRAIEKTDKGDIAMTDKVIKENVEDEPSYEEILDMEAWEEEERKNREKDNLNKRLAKFRHATKSREEELGGQVEEAEEAMGGKDVRTATLGDFLRSRGK